MTLIRLEDGRLVIHNGIALEEEEMRRIEEWGQTAFPRRSERRYCGSMMARMIQSPVSPNV